MSPIDQLIYPRYLLQLQPAEQGAKAQIHAQPNLGAAIHGGNIVAIDSRAALRRQYQPRATIELPDQLLMPGLVNACSHALGIVNRSTAQPSDLFACGLIGSANSNSPRLSDDELFASAKLAFTEMLLAGTTTCADMSTHSEAVAKAAEASGIHAQISVPITAQANTWTQSAQEGLDRALTLHDRYAHHPRISIAFGLPDLVQLDREALTKIAMYAEELNLQVQVLLQQSPAHLLALEDRHGCSGIALLEQHGLLGTQLQAVHVNALDDADLQLLQHYRVAVMRCPHRYAQQMRPWPWSQFGAGLGTEAGAGATQPVGLGTGGYAMNYYADLFHSIQQLDTNAIYQATQGSAQVMGLDENIGALAPGRLANLAALDLRLLDASVAANSVATDVPSLLLRGRAAQAVSHLWVAGALLVADHQPTT
ncbi:MAG: amidohydrolase family protein [Proteobacteria bacterium]|nr:amidohydrolase family protein [Pseudomonadota bacterium]